MLSMVVEGIFLSIHRSSVVIQDSIVVFCLNPYPCVSSVYLLICFKLVVQILSFLFILPFHHLLHLYIVILHLGTTPPYLFTSTF